MNSLNKYLQMCPEKCTGVKVKPYNRIQDNPKSSVRSKKPKAEEVLQKSTQTYIHHCHRRCSGHKHRQNQAKETEVRQCVDHPTFRCEQGSPHESALKSKLLQELKPVNALRLPSIPFDMEKVETQRPQKKVESAGAEGDCFLYKHSKFVKALISRNDKNSDKLSSLRTKNTAASSCQQPKRSSELLESTRAHCRQTKAQFEAKYVTTEDDSGNTMRTIITTNCGDQLRTVVRSQIEMQARNEFKFNTPFDLPMLSLSEETDVSPLQKKQYPMPGSASKHVTGSSRLDGNSLESFASVEDLIKSKVIAPMLRRVQRMYLNNLREEMILMEDLERVPCQLGELFKTVDLEALRGTVQK